MFARSWDDLVKSQPRIANFVKPPVDWNDLRIVLAVARATSVKKAAKQLRMTESTVSRHISAAEESLGVTLFERTPTGMLPTGACDALAERLARAESELEAGIEASAAVENQTGGCVRLTSVPIVINHIVIPAVGSFIRHFHDIELELVGLSSDLSMLRREADLAVRLSRPSTDHGAVTRMIGHLHYSVFIGADQSLDLPWITYEREMSALPQSRWIDDRRRNFGEETSPILCNDADGLIAAVRAGAGKSLLPREIVPPVTGLQELHGYDDLPVRELWLMAHPNLVMSRRIRVVIDWLVDLFATLEKTAATPP